MQRKYVNDYGTNDVLKHRYSIMKTLKQIKREVSAFLNQDKFK